MSSIILLVYEGEIIEKKIHNSIEEHFFKNKGNTVIRATFKGEIYQLWNRMKNDPYLDLFEIIKERDVKNKHQLKDINRKNVSQIYLFFDCDPQSCSSTTISCKKLSDMLVFFNEETEHGKLYISYPMVETIKDIKKDPEKCFNNCIIEIKKVLKYKQLVAANSDYTKIKKYTIEIWYYIIYITYLKAVSLVNGKYMKPSFDDIGNLNQYIIAKCQIERFIEKTNSMVTLSAFPFFLIEYFGQSLFEGVFSNSIEKDCKFSDITQV